MSNTRMCARVGCGEDANPLNGKYCSRECAPLGHLSTDRAGSGSNDGRGRPAIPVMLETGEVNGRRLAELLGVGASKISGMFNAGKIHGRRTKGVVWYRVDEVRESMKLAGYNLDDEGKVIFSEGWRRRRQSLKAAETARYQEAQ